MAVAGNRKRETFGGRARPAVRAARAGAGPGSAGAARHPVPGGGGVRAAGAIPLQPLAPQRRDPSGLRDDGAAPARGRAGVRSARPGRRGGRAAARDGRAEPRHRAVPPVPGRAAQPQPPRRRALPARRQGVRAAAAAAAPRGGLGGRRGAGGRARAPGGSLVSLRPGGAGGRGPHSAVPLLRRRAARAPQGEFLPALRAAAFRGAQVPGLRERGGRRLGVLRELRARHGLRVKRHAIAIIAGDGIGPEVIDAALGPIEQAAAKHRFGLDLERLPYSATHYLDTRETLPEAAFAHLRDDVDAILLGALGDPRVPGNEHARDILLGLRFRLDPYINFRPVRLLHPDLTPLRADRRTIDFVIFREKTKGVYLCSGRIAGDEYVAEEVNTAKGVERIIRAAFEWARAHGRTRVTMSDKSNAVPAHLVWQQTFKAISQE